MSRFEEIKSTNMNQNELRLGVNVKIIFHWMIVVPIIVLLILNFSVNAFAFSILLVFFILTLGLNRASYLQLTNDRLVIIKKNFLFIKTFEKSLEFKEIQELRILDNGPYMPDSFLGNYGSILLELFAGIVFYAPRHQIRAVYKSGHTEEVWVNTQKFEMNKLIKQLKTIANLDKVLKV